MVAVGPGPPWALWGRAGVGDSSCSPSGPAFPRGLLLNFSHNLQKNPTVQKLPGGRGGGGGVGGSPLPEGFRAKFLRFGGHREPLPGRRKMHLLTLKNPTRFIVRCHRDPPKGPERRSGGSQWCVWGGHGSVCGVPVVCGGSRWWGGGPGGVGGVPVLPRPVPGGPTVVRKGTGSVVNSYQQYFNYMTKKPGDICCWVNIYLYNKSVS